MTSERSRSKLESETRNMKLECGLEPANCKRIYIKTGNKKLRAEWMKSELESEAGHWSLRSERSRSKPEPQTGNRNQGSSQPIGREPNRERDTEKGAQQVQAGI